MGKRINGTDAGQTAIPERCYKKAEYLLENYVSLKKQKRQLLDELSHMRLYTHDDVLYLLSGAGSCTSETERVQTSNISNPCEKASLNADEMQERLNRGIGRDEKRQLDWVSDNLDTVEVAFTILGRRDPEMLHAARQLFVDREPKGKITDMRGYLYSRYEMKKMKIRIYGVLAECLWQEELFRKSSYGANRAEWWDTDV